MHIASATRARSHLRRSNWDCECSARLEVWDVLQPINELQTFILPASAVAISSSEPPYSAFDGAETPFA
jgi:hypothetical protein